MIPNSTISFNPEYQAFMCSACGEAASPVPQRIRIDPEKYVRLLEACQMEHADCKHYKNKAMAKAAFEMRQATLELEARKRAS